MERGGFTLVEVVVAVFFLSVAGLGTAKVLSEVFALIKAEGWETEKLALMQTVSERVLSGTCREDSGGGDTSSGVWSLVWTTSKDKNLGSVAVIAYRGTAEQPVGLTRLEYLRWCG